MFKTGPTLPRYGTDVSKPEILANLICFLCGLCVSLRLSALKGPLTQRTQRYAEGRRGKSSISTRLFVQSCVVSFLRFGLAALILHVLGVAALAQQILDAEQRLQRILPEGRADAEQKGHNHPAKQHLQIVMTTAPPVARVPN